MKKRLMMLLSSLLLFNCAKEEKKEPVVDIMETCLKYANEACPRGTMPAHTYLAADYTQNESETSETQTTATNDSQSSEETKNKDLFVAEAGDCVYECKVMCPDGSVPRITADVFECIPVEENVTYPGDGTDGTSDGGSDGGGGGGFCDADTYSFCEDWSGYSEGDSLNGWCADCSLVIYGLANTPVLGSYVYGEKEASLKTNFPSSFELELNYLRHTTLVIKLYDETGNVFEVGWTDWSGCCGGPYANLEDATVTNSAGRSGELNIRLQYRTSDNTYRLYLNDEMTVSYYSAAFANFNEITFPIEKDNLLLSYITIKAL